MLYIFQRPFLHAHNHDLCSICIHNMKKFNFIPLLCIHVYSYILWKVPSPGPKFCWGYHMFPSMLSLLSDSKKQWTTWLYMLTVTNLCPPKVLLHVQDIECMRPCKHSLIWKMLFNSFVNINARWGELRSRGACDIR